VHLPSKASYRTKRLFDCKGYCLVPNKQAESVKKIISARVAGIVDDDHVFPSELKNVLENEVHGTALVPSSEALRHLLLFEIKQQTNPGPASPVPRN
jgi:hypothetical protein